MLTEWEREWASAQWREKATAWSDAVLSAHGLRRTGAVQQPRIRTWSTALTVPTDAGRFWFKANCPGLRTEAAVVAALAEIAPDHVAAPIGVDAVRGWMLTPDHGPTLREAGRTEVGAWLRVVTEYADLQRRTTAHGDRLRAAGLAVLQPQDATGYVAERLEWLCSLPDSHPRYVDPALVERVRRVLPALRRRGEELACGAVPPALDHNDLHDNNTFVPPATETTLRFFDFGDALWAHPFCSMLIVVNVVTDPDGLDLSDAQTSRLLDAYLEAWTDLAPLPELRGLLDAALVLGRVHRHLSWDRTFTDVPAGALGERAGSPALWLELLAQCLEPGGLPRVL